MKHIFLTDARDLRNGDRSKPRPDLGAILKVRQRRSFDLSNPFPVAGTKQPTIYRLIFPILESSRQFSTGDRARITKKVACAFSLVALSRNKRLGQFRCLLDSRQFHLPDKRMIRENDCSRKLRRLSHSMLPRGCSQSLI